MKNLFQIPFDQYQRYEICRRLIESASHSGGRRFKVLDVGGFFKNEDGSPWLPATEFLNRHDVLVIDTVDAVAENYQKSDGRNLPFRDHEFDFVISNDVFEHIPPDDRRRFLMELTRVGSQYVILNNPSYSAKSAAAERIMYEYLVHALHHEHEMLGEHIKYKVPSRMETEKILEGFKYASYLSGDIDNWINFMILRHELYSRRVDSDLVQLMDSYSNEFHFENEMNLVEGYRSTFIVALSEEDSLLKENFFEQIEKHKALKIELPFASIVSMYQMKTKNEHTSSLDLYYPYGKQLLARFSRNHIATQSFQVNNDNFHKIGIMVATYKEKLFGKMKMSLFESRNGNSVKSEIIDLSTIVDNEWLYLDFVPEVNSSGRIYILEIAQVTEGSGISIYYDEDSEYGSLTLNGQTITGSLCIKTFVRDFDIAEKKEYFEKKFNQQALINEKLENEFLHKSNELENVQKELEVLRKQTQLQENYIHSLQNELSLLKAAHETEQAKMNQMLTQIETEVIESRNKLQDAQQFERIIFEKNNELDLVHKTISWKMTRPLRWSTVQKRKALKSFKVLKHMLDKNGGVYKGPIVLAYKSFATLNKEGFKGILTRVKLNKSASMYNLQPITKRAEEFLSNHFYIPEIIDVKSIPKHMDSTDIIVCVHNALEDVKRCLYSIVQYTEQPYTIILVDDGSGIETQKFLNDFSETMGAHLIRNETAKGYTLAANQGLNASKASYVVMLNSDTIVTPYWLEKMIECASSDARIGVVGPLSNTASWQSVPHVESEGDWADNDLPSNMSIADAAFMIDELSSREFPRISFLNGFCMMIKRELIKDIGVFDEETFAKGYGEENDYCLRARKAGWELAIADHVYIYHAQSKSYSHEKRKALVKHADEQLTNKHGQEIILQGVHQCRFDPVMEGIRSRVLSAFERNSIQQLLQVKYEGMKILFVLPILEASGGANVIFTEAKAMLNMGIDARILNLKRHQQIFENSYKLSSIPIPVLYADHESQIAAIADGYDLVVATTCNSVSWIKESSAKKAYYIQDFEPYFFETGSEQYEAALESYRLIPEMTRLTKTDWNAQILLDQVQVDSVVVGASLDIDLFKPRRVRQNEFKHRCLRVSAMIRPSTPRRNPAGTIRALREIAEVYGDQIEIIIFGCNSDDPVFQSLDLNFKWRNAGILKSNQLAALFNEVDIFIDLSTFQAMGLTALEAMACGVAVVAPIHGGSDSFIIHNENGLLVDTHDDQINVSAIKTLITDHELRYKIQQNAVVSAARYYPEKTVLNILAASFKEEVSL